MWEQHQICIALCFMLSLKTDFVSGALQIPGQLKQAGLRPNARFYALQAEAHVDMDDFEHMRVSLYFLLQRHRCVRVCACVCVAVAVCVPIRW